MGRSTNCVCFGGRRGIRGHDGWRSDRGRRGRSPWAPTGLDCQRAPVRSEHGGRVESRRPPRAGGHALLHRHRSTGSVSQRCRSRRGIRSAAPQSSCDHGDHRVHPPRCDARRPHSHSCPANSRLARALRDRWFAVDRHLFQFDALPSGIASLPRAAPRAPARTGPRTPAHGSQAGAGGRIPWISQRARPRAPP